MTLNDLERCNSPYFALFSPKSIALLANYVTVVEDRPMMCVKYCLPVPVFHFWQNPAAWSLCDSCTCIRLPCETVLTTCVQTLQLTICSQVMLFFVFICVLIIYLLLLCSNCCDSLMGPLCACVCVHARVCVSQSVICFHF